MPTAGLVNDTSFNITNDAIEGKNEVGGEDHISTGYHAVEFLLWGQDLSESGPGARPFTDYATADNASRRQLYLSTAASGIVSHLADLTDAWAPGSTTNYRNELVTATPREALRRIFTGLVIFSKNELGGERMVGIETGDQNDEHSCFSDNTTRDFVQDQLGVQNVFLGRYTRIDGTTIDGVGLDEVVAEVDPALAEALRQRIEASLAAAQALVPPYDTEIHPGNAAGHARLEALRSSLQTQGALLEDAMELLGLPFSPPEE
jgi:putative iron-regulated protein